MKVALSVLVLVATMELVLGVPIYGPPQPLPTSPKYRSPNGAPIPAKYPPHPSGNLGKNEFYSKFNPHSLPPGLRGPVPQLPPPFAKFPHLPPPGKHQQQYQQQYQQQHQPQQHQLHNHHQQQQQQQQKHQQQHQQQSNHPPANSRPVGPQFQSKPHLLQNGASHHSPQQGHVNNGPEQRVQLVPSRPTPKITNGWTGPKLSGSPDFPPRFPAAATPVAPVTTVPFLEKPRGPYIINSDDERGPIKTIPAPNLNPADKPANFEEQLYRAQHQQSYAQPLDNTITDDKLSYQVTEEPSGYKPFSSQPSYFAQDQGSTKVPSNTDSVPTVPLDIALQQHLDHQHHQQLSAEHVGSPDTLTPQELYSLLNGNQAAAVGPQATYMVQQPVMYAVPQPQSLDLQVGHQLQYQAQPVQLQYAQQPAATGVQLQYAQPAAADLQYLQPQKVQYQPQTVHYQPQAFQYQAQADHLQQPYQQQSVEPNRAQSTTAEISAHKQQQQQEQQQQQQEQQQQEQEQQQEIQLQQQQREQLRQQQQVEQEEQQQQQQQVDNDEQYQQEQDYYEPRNGDKGPAEQPPSGPEDGEHDQKKLQSIRDQYYSAVPNEQTAGVLAQIAQSAANNDVAVADEPSRVPDAASPAEKSPTDQSVQMHTSVQIQQSVPLYEATYASSRRTNQEYADEGGEPGELMEGSESVAVSESSSVNGHAPSQFPYSAAKINAFATN